MTVLNCQVKLFNLKKLDVLFLPRVSNDEDRVMGVEGNVVELSLFPRHHRLRADGVILVDMQVKDMHLTVNCHSCKHRAAVRQKRQIIIVLFCSKGNIVSWPFGGVKLGKSLHVITTIRYCSHENKPQQEKNLV